MEKEPVLKDPQNEIEHFLEKTLSFQEKVYKSSDEDRAIPAVGRNFAIHAHNEDSTTQLSLHHTDGRTIDLSIFLPPSATFAEADTFQVNWQTQQVFFIKEHMPFRHFLLSLFHELGHANIPYKPVQLSWLEKRQQRAFFNKRWDTLQSRLKKTYNNDHEKVKEVMQKLPNELFWPSRTSERLSQAKVTREREAWAWGVRNLRKLDSFGFNVFAGFENNAQIMHSIQLSLATYEVGQTLTNMNVLFGELLDKSILTKKEKKYYLRTPLTLP